jgi:glucan biosynthesis protein
VTTTHSDETDNGRLGLGAYGLFKISSAGTDIVFHLFLFTNVEYMFVTPCTSFFMLEEKQEAEQQLDIKGILVVGNGGRN